MSDWNCNSQCKCTLSFKVGSICPDKGCSTIYTPMAKSYLFVVVMLWSLECIGLLFLFGNSIYRINRSDKVSRSPLTSVVTSNAGGGDVKSSEYRRKSNIGRTLSKYRNSHQLLLILFILFFTCTAPIMTCFAIDFINPFAEFSHLAVNILTPLPFLYCLVCPILLARRLSGVRSAIMMAFTSTCSFTTTLPHRQSRRQTNKCDVMTIGMVADNCGKI